MKLRNPYPNVEGRKNRLFHLYELFRLIRRRWVSNHYLSKVAGIAFNQRLQELEADGAIIERKCKGSKEGWWVYRCTRLPSSR